MASLENKRILVAGAGLVGSALIDELLRSGNEVFVLSRFRDEMKRADFQSRGAKTFIVDVAKTSYEQVPGLPCEFDVVFHQIAVMVGAEDDREYSWQANCYSVGRLIDYCRGSGAFVIASTGGVYPVGDDPRKETDALGAAGTYNATKVGMEALARYLCEKHGIPLALLRYHWPYSAVEGMIPGFAATVLSSEPIEINCRVRSVVHPVWIDDVVRMTIAAAARAALPPYVVNIAGEEPVEREELIERVGKALGVTPILLGTDVPKISHVADLDKMHADFGKCGVSLDEGIRRVVEKVRASTP
jgi:nucleoside-diphosphate-sugar epimerase